HAGYVPERMFNAIHGRDRLNFAHPTARWTVDVVFDELRMSHRLDLRGRLNGPAPTVDLADLLLTKLQIWEINEKDLGDVVCVLADHELRGTRAARRGAVPNTDDPELVDVHRITSLCASDWGLCHTVQRNLGLARDLGARRRPAAADFEPVEQVAILFAAIDDAPKTLGWRSRARIGERVRWYETPRGGPSLDGETAPRERVTPPSDRDDEILNNLVVRLLEWRNHLQDEIGMGCPAVYQRGDDADRMDATV